MAARALPTPPPMSPSQSFSPLSPTKRDPALKPNPHPYAIRTTTSGLLSRANTGQNVDAAHHSYVPPSPTSRQSPDNRRDHRYSKSFSSSSQSPRPLPVPPVSPTRKVNKASHNNIQGGYASADESIFLSRAGKSADALLSFPIPDSSGRASVIPRLDELPSNPKAWTPHQLASYLVTALRVSSQTSVAEPEQSNLSLRVAEDIATFMKEAKISGRTFLRLNEEDLNRMGMNKRWCETLLAASHNLRQNVLKGRIWGPESSPNPSPESASPSLPVHPFSSALYNSSSSSVDLSAEIGVADGQARNGRVRGMVATFERSGSFSSDGSFDGDAVIDYAGMRRRVQREEHVEEAESCSPSPNRRPLPPLPISTQEEEPSIETLLASPDGDTAHNTGSWGARAWEEFDMHPGVTVKRVVETPISDSNGVQLEEKQLPGMQTLVGPGSGHRGIKGSRRGRERGDKRIVTAIFSPALTEEPVDAAGTAHVDDNAGMNVEPSPIVCANPHAELVVNHNPPESEALQERLLEHALEAEILATRALVDTFRRRLEVLEAKVSELEEREALRAKEASKDKLYSDRQDDAINGGVTRSSLLSQAASFLPVCIQDHVLGADSTKQTPGEEDDDDGPATVAEIPSYVLLVGLGVCAVVLRVVLRKIAGKNASIGWKP